MLLSTPSTILFSVLSDLHTLLRTGALPMLLNRPKQRAGIQPCVPPFKVNACWQAAVGHVVFSTLEDPRTLIPKGAMPELSKEPGRVVAHFESKAAVLVCSFTRCHVWGMQTCQFFGKVVGTKSCHWLGSCMKILHRRI